MNPIAKAIDDVKYRIPRPILEEAFIRRRGFDKLGYRTPVSLDYRIRTEVVEARVLKDCNLVGGTEITVPLASIVPQYLEYYKVVWRIPLALTNNRRIIRVYSLIYGTGGVPTLTNVYNAGGSAYDDAANGLLASHSPIPNVSDANIQLIGENTIMAMMNVPKTPHLWLRCVVENDGEMNNLDPGAVTAFCKLVELAVKAFCYNELVIKIDEAYLHGGQQLGKFLSILEEYADANQLYDEHFAEVWRKTAILSDPQAKKRHLKMLISGIQ